MKPSPNLGLVVVVPCCDEDFLLLSLLSLKKCEKPRCDVEVIVVINDGEGATPAVKIKNQFTYKQAQKWAAVNSLPYLKFHIIYKTGLPKKFAGVGLARKIGMDEACYRLERASSPTGIITGFDADCSCEANYFKALENHFKNHLDTPACSIYFEHPLDGVDYNENVYDAIAAYELHLRYYIQAQRWAGVPHAFQTIGSSMAVRCDAYQQQGGMNKRKAGEDFYFLQKFIALGEFTELKNTTVFPSPRPSHRVPFGTGKAVSSLLHPNKKCLTYHPKSFEVLRAFLMTNFGDGRNPQEILDTVPGSIRSFLENQQFGEKVKEIRANTASPAAFRKRFFRWFDAFMVMKFVHFARDHYYPDMEVIEAAKWLLQSLELAPEFEVKNHDARKLLLRFRILEKKLL